MARSKGNINKELMHIYSKMIGYFGPRNWWPAKTTFEVVVGAILTQSVAWRNVEKAIDSLEQAGLLEIKAIYQADTEEIARHIVPTLYYRMKSRKLKAFAELLVNRYEGLLSRLFDQELYQLREELLAVYGIGPETADSIILYAAEKPIFVVDAYTKRIFYRLGYFKNDIDYTAMQKFFMSYLPAETSLYNEYHALIVGIGNQFCANKKPACEKCPLNEICKFPKGKIK